MPTEAPLKSPVVRTRSLRNLENCGQLCLWPLRWRGFRCSMRAPAAAGESGRRGLSRIACFAITAPSVTGAAVWTLLPGSSAIIVSNCLFVGNVGNRLSSELHFRQPGTTPEFTQTPAPLTVFPTSRALVRNCTFTGNRNAVDDLGGQSDYQDCVFWQNTVGNAF